MSAFVFRGKMVKFGVNFGKTFEGSWKTIHPPTTGFTWVFQHDKRCPNIASTANPLRGEGFMDLPIRPTESHSPTCFKLYIDVRYTHLLLWSNWQLSLKSPSTCEKPCLFVLSSFSKKLTFKSFCLIRQEISKNKFVLA